MACEVPKPEAQLPNLAVRSSYGSRFLDSIKYAFVELQPHRILSDTSTKTCPLMSYWDLLHYYWSIKRYAGRTCITPAVRMNWWTMTPVRNASRNSKFRKYSTKHTHTHIFNTWYTCTSAPHTHPWVRERQRKKERESEKLLFCFLFSISNPVICFTASLTNTTSMW